EKSASKPEPQELKAEVERQGQLISKLTQALAGTKSKTEAQAIVQQRQQAISSVEVSTLLTQCWVALTGSQSGILSRGKSPIEGRSVARRLTEQALAIDPSNPKVHTRMGVVLTEEGNYAAAVTEFHEALRLNPRDPGAHNALANTLRANGDMTGAI